MAKFYLEDIKSVYQPNMNFDVLFNYDRTAKRVLEIIEGLAQQVRQT